jgi:hypothetical protein
MTLSHARRCHRARAHTHARSHTHARARAHTHTRTHTHTHTHTHRKREHSKAQPPSAPAIVAIPPPLLFCEFTVLLLPAAGACSSHFRSHLLTCAVLKLSQHPTTWRRRTLRWLLATARAKHLTHRSRRSMPTWPVKSSSCAVKVRSVLSCGCARSSTRFQIVASVR